MSAVQDKSREVISNRAVGQFPISIATSLAFESAIGILPEAPAPEPEIKKRDLIMVNVRTLIRNLLGSFEKEDKVHLENYTLAEALVGEMRVMETLAVEHSNGRCRVEFYTCTYDDLQTKFTRALIKVPTTPLQVAYMGIEKDILKYIKDDFKSAPPVEEYTRNFKDHSGDALIVTHFPIDLLQRYRFNSLSLLESHTGAIKPPLLWNTKLKDGKEFENIPFDRMTLQMFGDGVLFAPMPIKIRQRVYSIAIKQQWTPASTKDWIIRGIEAHRDPALEVLVKDLYRK
jgi:hypothetical protein